MLSILKWIIAYMDKPNYKQEAEVSKSIYQGKKVLCIGARKKVLVTLSSALNEQGFKAQWTTNNAQPEAVWMAYSSTHFDVIAFGRGVSPESKATVKQKFTEYYPSISFVDGLAPITNLLVDQIKFACKTATSKPVRVQYLSNNGIVLEGFLHGHIVVKHYRLNWLFQSKESMLYTQEVDKQQVSVPFKRKSGANFIVVSLNGLVIAVHTL